MDETRINRLSKRQCDVLRGVADLKKTKQIAADLGIAPGTVDGYIAEAVRILGVADRGEAARLLVRYEANAPLNAPGESGGQSSWVATEPVPTARAVQPDAEPDAPTADRTPSWAGSMARVLPIRRSGQRVNDLPVATRLLWVPAIAMILAVSFGMLASGLTVLADLIERLSHLVR